MAVDAEGLLIRLDATTESLRRELRRAQRSVGDTSKRMERDIRRVDKAFDKLNRMASTLRRGLGMLGVGLSLQGIRSIAQGALNAADSLATTADRVALNVETLQELRSAAAEVNVQANQLDMGMQRFTRRLAEAAQGGGELKGILEQYKIELRDGNDQLRTSEQVLYDLADAIQQAESDGERLRIAFKAFDSEGAALVNLLRRGSRGMDEARRRARDLGHVLSEDVVRAASSTNTELNNLFQTIRTQINEGLLETLTQDTGDLSAIAKDPQFHSGLQAIGQGIGFIGQAVAAAIGQLGNFVQLLRDPSWENLGDLLSGSTVGLAGRMAAHHLGGDQGVARAQQLAQISERMAETRETIAALERSGIENAEMRLEQERETLRELEKQRNEIMAQLDGSAEGLLGPGATITLPSIRVSGDPVNDPPATPGGGGTGTTIDVGAQAALAAMQRVTQVRDQHADAVGEMLTGLRQEAELNEVTLQHLHDQSGELEVQQRLLEIRQQLGAEAAAEAEPVLRHIQQQTNAIERQTNAYEFLNASAERAFDRIGSAMTRMFMEGEDAAITWANTVNAILSEIMQTMMQLAVINPLKNALFGGNAATTADIGGILGSLFHSGGIVGQPTQTRMVSPLAFAGAPRMHAGGIAGDEVPAILKRGEEVLPESHPRHRNNAGGGVEVNIPVKVVNNAPVQVRTRQAQAPGGGKQLEILIDEMNARNIGSPGTASNKAVRNSFGAQPMLTTRG